MSPHPSENPVDRCGFNKPFACGEKASAFPPLISPPGFPA
jgi:hypothetical protein